MSAARIQTPSISNLMIDNIESRINSLDWPRISAGLHQSGWDRTGEVLTEDECRELRRL